MNFSPSPVGERGDGGVVGWVGGGPAGCARRAVRLIYAGWDRRTMVRRGVPLSSIGRGQPFGWAGCSSVFRGFPARCRAATDPADGMALLSGVVTRFG